jgi:hypothetical protein
MELMEIKGIWQALREGCKLHVSLSETRLRTVNLLKDGKLKGYGEHPFVEGALLQASDDFLSGHKQDFGKKKYPRFARGELKSTGLLDNWVSRGNGFDCWLEDGQVIIQFRGVVKNKDVDAVLGKVKMTEF